MEKTERRAYAKINPGLDVLRRRENGYHDVKMVMQTVGIYDELTFEKIKEGIVVTTDKEELPTDKGNLIHRPVTYLQILSQIPAAPAFPSGSLPSPLWLLLPL